MSKLFWVVMAGAMLAVVAGNAAADTFICSEGWSGDGVTCYYAPYGGPGAVPGNDYQAVDLAGWPGVAVPTTTGNGSYGGPGASSSNFANLGSTYGYSVDPNAPVNSQWGQQVSGYGSLGFGASAGQQANNPTSLTQRLNVWIDPAQTVNMAWSASNNVGDPESAYLAFAPGGAPAGLAYMEATYYAGFSTPYTVHLGVSQASGTGTTGSLGSITTAGWYTFEASYSNVGGNLQAAYSVFAASGAADMSLAGTSYGTEIITTSSPYSIAGVGTVTMESVGTFGLDEGWVNFIDAGGFEARGRAMAVGNAWADGTFTAEQAPVPEPVSMIFFGTGLVGLCGYLARRRNR